MPAQTDPLTERVLQTILRVTAAVEEIEKVLGIKPASPKLELVPEPAPPFEYSDEDLLPALEQALADWREEFESRGRERPEGVSAGQVVRVLGGASFNPSHVSRVVHGLRRLAPAGQVVYLRPKDRRIAGQWTLSDA